MANYTVVVPAFYYRNPLDITKNKPRLGIHIEEWTHLELLRRRLAPDMEILILARSPQGFFAGWVPDMGAFYHWRKVLLNEKAYLLGYYAMDMDQMLQSVSPTEVFVNPDPPIAQVD